MSDCKCGEPERRSRQLIFSGTNTGSPDIGRFGSFYGYIDIVADESSGYAVGAPVGAFNSARPGQFVLHTDWCCRRPSKASISCQGTPHGQGTARVFVESKRDFSAYVFAETQATVMQFEPFGDRHHTQDGTVGTFATYPSGIGGGAPVVFSWYGPVFGAETDGFEFSPRNEEDDSSYLESAWPVGGWNATSNGRYQGVQKIVRCGYREDGEDVVVAQFVQPRNVPALTYNSVTSADFGAISIGCHLDDVAGPDNSVRCGLEVNGASPGNASFSFPFVVPGRVLLDNDALPLNRFVGASATSSPGQLGNVQTGFLDIAAISTAVTCGADHANIFFDPNGEYAEGTVPALAIRKNETFQGFVSIDGNIGPVDESEAFYVRRPDIMGRVPDMVAAADSWHSRHLVWKGSDLAQRNARHSLMLEFVEVDNVIEPEVSPADRSHYSGGKIPARIRWFGQRNYSSYNFFSPFFRLSEPLENRGPQFYLDWYDEYSYGPLGVWLWNAIAGSHTLEPSMGDLPLTADAFHVHYDEPFKTEEHEIEEPDSNDIERGGGVADGHPASLGPFTDEEWDEIQSVQSPHRMNDYRVEWKVETFPQLWATTDLALGAADGGPLDIDLVESGMTSEAHDFWSGVPFGREWSTIWPFTGGSIHVRARIGWRVSITKVQGFRRVRAKGAEVNVGNTAVRVGGSTLYPPGSAYPPGTKAWNRNETGEVEVFGDHDCNDVACSETVVDFSIPLTHAEIMTLSAGELVDKQFLVAEHLTNPAEVDEGAEPIYMPVYRTIRVRVMVD